MQRSKRLTILLGILAVIAVVTIVVMQYEEKQEEIETSGEVVLAVDPGTVQSLSWTYMRTKPMRSIGRRAHGSMTRTPPSRSMKRKSAVCSAYLNRSAQRLSSKT